MNKTLKYFVFRNQKIMIDLNWNWRRLPKSQRKEQKKRHHAKFYDYTTCFIDDVLPIFNESLHLTYPSGHKTENTTEGRRSA